MNSRVSLVFSFGSKVASLFFSFIFVLVLTKIPSTDYQVELSSAFLSVSSIVSLLVNFIFISKMMEDIENNKKATVIDFLVYLLLVIKIWFVVLLLFNVNVSFIIYISLLGIIQSCNQYIDIKILYTDRFTNESTIKNELIRLIIRFASIALAYAFFKDIVVFNFGLDLVYMQFVMILYIIFCSFVFGSTIREYHFRSLTKYRVSILLGNFFWILPRIVFFGLGKESDVLRYSYLQSMGTGVQQLITLFYGRLLRFLSTNKKNERVYPLYKMSYFYVFVLVLIVLSEFFIKDPNISDFIIIFLFALSVFIQSVSRAGIVNSSGGDIASKQYLKSLFVGFPLVVFSSLYFNAAIVIYSLIFTQLIRTVLYEKNAILK